MNEKAYALFIPGEAKGAIPNGTRVKKTLSEPGDTHKDGELATVMSSRYTETGILYFVEWDSHPGVPVLIAGHRIARAE